MRRGDHSRTTEVHAAKQCGWSTSHEPFQSLMWKTEEGGLEVGEEHLHWKIKTQWPYDSKISTAPKDKRDLHVNMA